MVIRVGGALVPPGSLIIEPEQIATIRHLLDDVQYVSKLMRDTTDDEIAILTTLIGDANAES